MMHKGTGQSISRATLALFSIHVLTASGAVLALMALIQAAQGEWSHMFYWLAAALFVDAIDGPIARRTGVAEKLPRWSGATLDLVVDFVTYVFVPAYAIVVSGYLPDGLDYAAGAAIVLTSAIYFSDQQMKLEDNYFQGFPAIWNAAAFYLFLIAPPQWAGALFVFALLVMTFLPIPFIHPVRVVRLRYFNMALLVLWSVLALVAMAHDMAAGPFVTGTLCAIGVYILGGGYFRRPA